MATVFRATRTSVEVSKVKRQIDPRILHFKLEALHLGHLTKISLAMGLKPSDRTVNTGDIFTQSSHISSDIMELLPNIGHVKPTPCPLAWLTLLLPTEEPIGPRTRLLWVQS